VTRYRSASSAAGVASGCGHGTPLLWGMRMPNRSAAGSGPLLCLLRLLMRHSLQLRAGRGARGLGSAGQSTWENAISGRFERGDERSAEWR
jgi:hypothetical protein